MLIILFGLSGSGKNFVGNILQKHFGYHFSDADTVLPPEMRASIENKIPFTQAMRDNYTQIIIKHIAELSSEYQDLAVAQALYKEKNRLEIQTAYPKAKFFQIKADPEQIVARLTRNTKLTDPDYAKTISINYDPPKLAHQTIDNNETEETVISQLRVCLR